MKALVALSLCSAFGCTTSDKYPYFDACILSVLPTVADWLNGRVLVAHNAPFDRRVLRRAFEQVGFEWPNPPVLCTAALARKLLPLQNRRGLTVLADALGIEVETAHRALADAETCAHVMSKVGQVLRFAILHLDIAKTASEPHRAAWRAAGTQPAEALRHD